MEVIAHWEITTSGESLLGAQDLWRLANFMVQAPADSLGIWGSSAVEH